MDGGPKEDQDVIRDMKYEDHLKPMEPDQELLDLQSRKSRPSVIIQEFVQCSDDDEEDKSSDGEGE